MICKRLIFSLSIAVLLFKSSCGQNPEKFWKPVAATLSQNISGILKVQITDTESPKYNQDMKVEYDLVSESYYLTRTYESGEVTHTLVTPALVAFWNGEKTGNIDVFDPLSDEALSRKIDIKAFGVCPPESVANSRQVLGDFFKMIEDLKLSNHDSSSANYEIPDPNAVAELVVEKDPSNQTIRNISLYASQNGESRKLLQDQHFEWGKKGGVSVPLRSEHKRSNGSTNTANFNWQKVNKSGLSFPDKPEAMRAFSGILIVDHRLGPSPVVVGKIGESNSPYTLRKRSFIGLIAIGSLFAVVAGWTIYVKRKQA